MNKSKFYTLAREPLLHFLVIGAVLFLVFAQTNNTNAKNNNNIIITQTDLDLLASIWVKSAGRSPTEQEREQQLKRYIREQILYREAVAMGLDKNDVVIRQRLAKRMEYLFNDLSFIPEPTEEELVSFLKTHAEEFLQPATISFKHIFFDPNQRGQNTSKDAAEALTQLKASTEEVDTINLGDRLLLPYAFSDERENRLASMFGDAFSNQTFTLPIKSWQGPITSSYGSHLVYINARTEEQLPPLIEIRERVTKQWRSEKQKNANELFYQSLHQHYKIVIDSEVKENAMANTAQ